METVLNFSSGKRMNVNNSLCDVRRLTPSDACMRLPHEMLPPIKKSRLTFQLIDSLITISLNNRDFTKALAI